MEPNKTEKIAETPVAPEGADKKEKKKHEKVKHERPAQYERNADLITEETVLEPLPKKGELLQRPVLKDYQDREAKNREKITKLIQKKKQIFAERFKPNRPLVKGEGGAHENFQQQIQEFKSLKDQFADLKTVRNEKRDLFAKLIEEAKANNADLKRYKDSSKTSREYFEQQLEKMEHRLITDQLSKEEERNLNSEIMIVKRKIKDSEPAGNVEVKIEKAEQRKQELDAEIQKLKHEKQPIEEQCRILKEKMDAKNAQIEKLKGDMKNQSAQKTEAKEKNDKEYEDWKESKKKLVDQSNLKIKELDDLNKKIWVEYKEKNDAYWEQKHKVDFLEWQHRVKERKVRDKEREKKRQLAIEREKEREKQQNLKKYIKEIELCNFLVNYLRDLTQEKETKQEQKAEQPTDINAKLGEDSQWKKEKGLVVLQSKKSKQDDEPVKKGKKSQKKNQKSQDTTAKKFEIPFNIQLLFEQLKLLAPQSAEEVPKKIQEIKERESLFVRACGEQFSETDQQEIEKIKGNEKKDKMNKPKEEKKQQDEFPTL